jgi:hypothetical protein
MTNSYSYKYSSSSKSHLLVCLDLRFAEAVDQIF